MKIVGFCYRKFDKTGFVVGELGTFSALKTPLVFFRAKSNNLAVVGD